MATTHEIKASSAESKNLRRFTRLLNYKIPLSLLALSYVSLFVSIGLIALASFYFKSQTIRTLLLAFGSSLLPMALLTMFFEYFSRQDLMDEFDKKVQAGIKKELKNRIIGSLNEMDSQLKEDIELELRALVEEEFANCFSELESQLEDFNQARLIASGIVSYTQFEKQDEAVYKLLGSAKETIRVCKTWIPEIEKVKAGLKKALRGGGTVKDVRILCLDPESPFAIQRSRDVGEGDSGKEQIEKHLRDLHYLFKGEKRVEIRIYPNLPSVSLYAADDTALIGWYWHSHESFKGPVLKVKGKSYHLSNCVQQNFDELWKTAKPYVPKIEEKES
jgi:hypothetical protein